MDCWGGLFPQIVARDARQEFSSRSSCRRYAAGSGAFLNLSATDPPFLLFFQECVVDVRYAAGVAGSGSSRRMDGLLAG